MLRFIIIVFFISTVCFADDRVIELNSQFEKKQTLEFKTDIEKLFELVVLSDGQFPDNSNYPVWINRASKDVEKSQVLALNIMALGMQGKDGAAFNRYSEFKNTFSSSDYHKSILNGSSSIVQSTYSWLSLNHLNRIPHKFVQKYPEAFDEGGHSFGSTYDVHWMVEIPDELDINNVPEYVTFVKTLYRIRNPGTSTGQCSMGTREHAYGKDRRNLTALLVLNPEYYLAKYRLLEEESVDWLSYWKNTGTYEHNLYRQLESSQSASFSVLSKFIQENSSLTFEQANTVVDDYLHRLTYMLVKSSVSGNLKELLTIFEKNGTESLLKENYVSDNAILAVVAKLIEKANVDGIKQVLEHVDKGNNELLHEVINQFASAESSYIDLIKPEFFVGYKTWGRFNKTPFMYAAHANNLKSYKLLKSILPREQLMNKTIKSDDSWDCSIPSIGERTILTYVLENGSLNFINTVLIDVGNEFAPKLDTDGRNAFYYLSRNTILSYSERVKVINVLKQLKTPILKASFDCGIATTPNELHVCGSEKFASLDKDINKDYSKSRSSLNKNGLIEHND